MRLFRNPEVRFPLLGMLATAGLMIGVIAVLLKETSYLSAVLWAAGAAFTVCIVIFLSVLILFNSLKIIQNIYLFERDVTVNKLEKRTTLNYAVPILVILFLMLKIIL